MVLNKKRDEFLYFEYKNNLYIYKNKSKSKSKSKTKNQKKKKPNYASTSQCQRHNIIIRGSCVYSLRRFLGIAGGGGGGRTYKRSFDTTIEVDCHWSTLRMHERIIIYTYIIILYVYVIHRGRVAVARKTLYII